MFDDITPSCHTKEIEKTYVKIQLTLENQTDSSEMWYQKRRRRFSFKHNALWFNIYDKERQTGMKSSNEKHYEKMKCEKGWVSWKSLKFIFSVQWTSVVWKAKPNRRHVQREKCIETHITKTTSSLTSSNFDEGGMISKKKTSSWKVMFWEREKKVNRRTTTTTKTAAE